MRLTKKKALKLTIELWEWLAETGTLKREWPEWKKYGEMDNECPLCEYVGRDARVYYACKGCPLGWGHHGCEAEESQYRYWYTTGTTKGHKKYARKFLAQLKEIYDSN